MFISATILFAAGIVMCILVIIVSIKEIRLYNKLRLKIAWMEQNHTSKDFVSDFFAKKHVVESLLDRFDTHVNDEPNWKRGMFYFPHPKLGDGIVNLATALGYEWVPESQEKTPAHWAKIKKGGKDDTSGKETRT